MKYEVHQFSINHHAELFDQPVTPLSKQVTDMRVQR